MKFWFYDHRGKVCGQDFSSDFIRIGRGPNCDFSIPNDTVSADHASISLIDGKCVISDLNSTNGTLVNGELIRKKMLRNGDIIQLGAFECWFEERSAPGKQPIQQRDTPEISTFSFQRTLRALEKSVCLCLSSAIVKTYPCNANGDLPNSIQEKDGIFKSVKSGEPFFNAIDGEDPKNTPPFSKPEPLELLKDNKYLEQTVKNAANIKLAYPIGRNASSPKAVLYVELFEPDTLTPGTLKNIQAAVSWAVQLIDNPAK